MKDRDCFSNYPKVGDQLTAIKSGWAHRMVGEVVHAKLYGEDVVFSIPTNEKNEAQPKVWYESHVTKGKTYTVVDYCDVIHGYLHLIGDDDPNPKHWSVRVLLTPAALKRFFGIELQVKPMVKCSECPENLTITEAYQHPTCKPIIQAGKCPKFEWEPSHFFLPKVK